MTAHEWKDSYDAKAKNYSRAPIVEAWYQDGGMNKVNWSSEQVKALFVTDTGTAPPGVPPGERSETPEGTEQVDSGTQIPAGAIAGAGAGGMLALAILVTLAIWMVYRHKKAKKDETNKPQWPQTLKQSSSHLMEMPIDRPESDRLCGYRGSSRLANNTSSNSARMSVQRVEVSVNNDHWELPVAPKALSVDESRRVTTKPVDMGVELDHCNLQDR
ncbi:Putative protein of unknown function [Podospora comata]|uniref:Uncharacterized protein n=1 Tax=Podospora comata TaxID=48703 RepID=A0ABY6RZE7_PODCO|nr:Putative protein of unknown function [Podospora comata]